MSFVNFFHTKTYAEIENDETFYMHFLRFYVQEFKRRNKESKNLLEMSSNGKHYIFTNSMNILCDVYYFEKNRLQKYIVNRLYKFKLLVFHYHYLIVNSLCKFTNVFIFLKKFANMNIFFNILYFVVIVFAVIVSSIPIVII